MEISGEFRVKFKLSNLPTTPEDDPAEIAKQFEQDIKANPNLFIAFGEVKEVGYIYVDGVIPSHEPAATITGPVKGE